MSGCPLKKSTCSRGFRVSTFTIQLPKSIYLITCKTLMIYMEKSFQKYSESLDYSGDRWLQSLEKSSSGNAWPYIVFSLPCVPLLHRRSSTYTFLNKSSRSHRTSFHLSETTKAYPSPTRNIELRQHRWSSALPIQILALFSDYPWLSCLSCLISATIAQASYVTDCLCNCQGHLLAVCQTRSWISMPSLAIN